MDLVTIDDARSHCRADSDDDNLLSIYGDAAEEAVQNFLNRRVFANDAAMQQAIDDSTAGDSPMVVTPVIRSGVLLILGHLYRNREEVLVSSAPIQLPMGATQLLWPHRVGLGV